MRVRIIPDFDLGVYRTYLRELADTEELSPNALAKTFAGNCKAAAHLVRAYPAFNSSNSIELNKDAAQLKVLSDQFIGALVLMGWRMVEIQMQLTVAEQFTSEELEENQSIALKLLAQAEDMPELVS